MTSIPYFLPLGDRRPIVERVEQCRPRYEHARFQDGLVECAALRDDLNFYCGELWVWEVNDDIAAALTRDAIKCWACEGLYQSRPPRPGLGIEVHHARDMVSRRVDHAEVNEAAHALADALGVAP
jgi:hypothetical protein